MTWYSDRDLRRALWRDDVCVGMVDTPEIAAAIVEAMNGQVHVDVPPDKVLMEREYVERALWISPRRLSGRVCVAGHRLDAWMVGTYVQGGGDVTEMWEITEEQGDLCRWWVEKGLAMQGADDDEPEPIGGQE